MTQNAVANIMSQVKLQEQEPTSMWGKFKNFAGSDGGRMLLGGLGTALAVGLSGGDTKKALAYGVQGAGNVANNIYQREERAKKRYDDAMQTALQWQNQEANRKLQETLQADRIQAQKDLATANYNNAISLLNEEATIEEQSKKRQREAEDSYYNDLYVNAGLTPEQIAYANLQRKGIDPNNMASQMAYNTLYNPNATPEQKELAREQLVNMANVNKEISNITKPSLTLDDIASGAKNFNISATPESFGNYIKSGNLSDLVWTDKPLSGELGLLIYMRDTLKMPTDEALDRLGKMTSEEKKELERKMAQDKSNIKVDEHQQISNIDTNAYNTKAGIDYKYQQQGADAQSVRDMLKAEHENKLKKDFENYKNSLPPQEVIRAMATADVLQKQGFKITAGDIVLEDYLGKVLANNNIQSQIDDRKTTPQIKNAEYVQENPGMANSPIFKNGTTVNVGTGQNNTEFNKQLAKNMADEYKEYQKALREATAQLNVLDEMSKAIDNPKVYQGSGGGIVNTYKTLLSSIGFDVEGLDDASIINSGRSQLMGSLRKDLMPGPMSDRDIEFLTNMTPGLDKTPEQNRAILNLFRKAYQRQVEVADFVNDYIIKNGTWDAKGQAELRKMDRPIFTKEERASVSGSSSNSGFRIVGVR